MKKTKITLENINIGLVNFLVNSGIEVSLNHLPQLANTEKSSKSFDKIKALAAEELYRKCPTIKELERFLSSFNNTNCVYLLNRNEEYLSSFEFKAKGKEIIPGFYVGEINKKDNKLLSYYNVYPYPERAYSIRGYFECERKSYMIRFDFGFKKFEVEFQVLVNTKLGVVTQFKFIPKGYSGFCWNVSEETTARRKFSVELLQLIRGWLSYNLQNLHISTTYDALPVDIKAIDNISTRVHEYNQILIHYKKYLAILDGNW